MSINTDELRETAENTREMQEYLEARAVADAAMARFKADALRRLEEHLRAVMAIYADLQKVGCYNPRELAVVYYRIFGERSPLEAYLLADYAGDDGDDE